MIKCEEIKHQKNKGTKKEYNEQHNKQTNTHTDTYLYPDAFSWHLPSACAPESITISLSLNPILPNIVRRWSESDLSANGSPTSAAGKRPSGVTADFGSSIRPDDHPTIGPPSSLIDVTYKNKKKNTWA